MSFLMPSGSKHHLQELLDEILGLWYANKQIVLLLASFKLISMHLLVFSEVYVLREYC